MVSRTKQSPFRSTPATLPGSSLRRKLVLDIFTPVVVFMCVISVIAGMIIGIGLAVIGSQWLGTSLGWLVIGVLIVIEIIILVVFKVVFKPRIEEQIDNLALGIRGEMAVAERLLELRPDGYEIFNDLPFDNRQEDGPNIDHVIVGPGGIFTIETKVRSKGEREEITFDGKQLTIKGFPIAERAIGQTLGNARRIGEILSEVTGRRVVSQPCLVFVGRWWINDKRPSQEKDALWVLNDEGFIQWIKTRKPILSPDDVALYATRLREYVGRT